MSIKSFIFGGDTGVSYEELKRRREALDAARFNDSSMPQSLGGGLSALGKALGMRLQEGRLNKAETARENRADNVMSEFQKTLGGGGQNPVSRSMSSSVPEMDGSALRDGIASTANSLGIDPVDLATAISYETAGSFSPTQKGPTTQWGQHRGLIQFGEPQAKKYGVDWNNPVGSQLGPDGAIAKYLRDTGVKPGMGLLDIYSAINAGGVGRYNRSDANNGGAPGTVRDKVEEQMAAHRAKALAMFKDYHPQQAQPFQAASLDPNADAQMAFAPQNEPSQIPSQMEQPQLQAQPQPPVQMAQSQTRQSGPFNGIDPRLMQMMGDPSLSPQQRSAMQLLLEQRLKANAPMDPLKALQIQKMQQELKRLQHPDHNIIQGADGFKYYQDTGERVLPGVAKPQPSPTDDMREYQLAKSQGYEGTLQDWILGQRKAGATSVNVNTGNNPAIPEYNKLPAGYIYKRDQNGKIMIDSNGVPTAVPIAGGPAALEAEKQAAAEKAKQASTERNGNVVLEDIDRALNGLDKGFLPTAGPVGGVLSELPGTQAYDVGQLIETIKANSGFDRLQAMRDSSPTGGALGQISSSEMGLLQAALGNLSQSQSEDQLKFNLQRVRKIYQEIVNGPSQTGGQAVQQMKQKAPHSANDDGWVSKDGNVRIRLKPN